MQTGSSLPSSGGAPEVLGRYRLGCELASGGMATVYLALPVDATVVARPMALKRIHPHLATEPEFVAMFIDEARIASKLRHPNLCGVLDFGEVDGTYFMTMEYLVGEPLSRLQRATLDGSKDVPIERQRVAAQIVADAAEGLHAAHELRDEEGRPMNVVHRDVSPSNLFVTYDGLTRVVDFGIASAADRLHHTATGSIKGKFGYMPPEQLRGEKVGRSADIWALGVVLWESLAGRRLFRRENASLTMLASLEGRVPPLAEVVRGVDPSLAAVVGRALAHDREARFPTALMLAEALQRFLARTGSPSARPEVAATLRAAFPEGEREKRRMMKAVAEERRPLEGLDQNDTHPSVSRTGRSQTGVVVKTDGAKPRPGGDPSAAPTDTPPAAPRDPSKWKAPLVSGLVAALLAFGAAWTMRGMTGAPPAAVAPAETGEVSVFTEGASARVYHRGHLLGTTPGRFTLPAGRQALSLRADDRGPARVVTVRVRAGATTEVRTRL